VNRIPGALRWLALAVLAGCAAGAPGPDSGSAPAPRAGAAAGAALEVRYLANEGFLVDGAGRRVLVDALFGAGIPGYAAVAAQLRPALEGGEGDWGGVGLALATHDHPDHFDPGAAIRFLEANPEAVFVSTPQARARLGAGRPELAARFRAVLPAAGEVERLSIGGVEIAVLNLHHGHREPPVENLGFVVTLGGLRFLHFGDTEATLEDFEPYLPLLADPELALLPFWFLASEWRAAMVRDRIRPRWIVAAHTPLPTAPATYFARWSSYENLLRVMTAAFPDAILPPAAGESWTFRAGE